MTTKTSTHQITADVGRITCSCGASWPHWTPAETVTDHVETYRVMARADETLAEAAALLARLNRK